MKKQIAVSVVFACLVATSACSSAPDEESVASTESELGVRPGCEAVRCALPLCVQGQHLAYQGTCCPTCVGKPQRCASVLCAAVACGPGEILVREGAGDCCGHCAAAPAVKECSSSVDCPQLYCIRCPCPVSECQGTHCVTHTPAESTCGLQ